MKALSIKQPWAHAIVMRWKDVENRSRRTSHRGWFAVHASQTPNKKARYPRGWKTPDIPKLQTSAIVGIAWLQKVVTPHKSPWFYRPGRGETNHAYVLTEAHRLSTPLDCDGKLGFWNVPPRLARDIRRQLPGVDFKRKPPKPD